MKLIAQSLLSGIFLTIVILVLVFIVDVSNGGNDAGISLFVRTLFAWVFFWSFIFLESREASSNLDLLIAVLSNTVLYSVLSCICLRRTTKKRLS